LTPSKPGKKRGAKNRPDTDDPLTEFVWNITKTIRNVTDKKPVPVGFAKALEAALPYFMAKYPDRPWPKDAEKIVEVVRTMVEPVEEVPRVEPEPAPAPEIEKPKFTVKI
jgi:hypothetical protein